MLLQLTWSVNPLMSSRQHFGSRTPKHSFPAVALNAGFSFARLWTVVSSQEVTVVWLVSPSTQRNLHQQVPGLHGVPRRCPQPPPGANVRE